MHDEKFLRSLVLSHSFPQQPKMRFFQLKKVFAIWLNAPLEANKLKCIVIISIIIVVVDIYVWMKLQTTKAFYKHIISTISIQLYNLIFS